MTVCLTMAQSYHTSQPDRSSPSGSLSFKAASRVPLKQGITEDWMKGISPTPTLSLAGFQTAFKHSVKQAPVNFMSWEIKLDLRKVLSQLTLSPCNICTSFSGWVCRVVHKCIYHLNVQHVQIKSGVGSRVSGFMGISVVVLSVYGECINLMVKILRVLS